MQLQRNIGHTPILYNDIDLHISPTNSLLANNTIRTQGPIIWNWNTLNHNIKTCRSLASFKNSLKKHILGQYNSEVTNNMINEYPLSVILGGFIPIWDANEY